MLTRTVAELARVLERRCRIRRRKATPCTFDRLLAHDYEGRQTHETVA